MSPMHQLPTASEGTPISRWTITLLVEPRVAAAFVEYASNPAFDKYIAGYRAGNGRGSKQFSFPHATSVHFEGTEEDYNAVVEYVRQWTAVHQQPICAGLLNDSNKAAVIPIAAGYQTYTTDSEAETFWCDFNFEKEPFMLLHNAVVDFIELRNMNLAAVKPEIKIINGKRDKHRPHATVGRFDKKALDSGELVLPDIELPLIDGKINFDIAAGPSHLSGEVHEPKVLISKGVCSPFPTKPAAGPKVPVLGC